MEEQFEEESRQKIKDQGSGIKVVGIQNEHSVSG